MPRLFADCTAPNTNDLGLKSNKSVLHAVTLGIATFCKGFIAFKPQVDQLESHSQLFLSIFYGNRVL